MKLAFISLATALSLATSAALSAKVETWTDMDGRSMEAELISASDKYASFRKADGTRYVFPLEKLSAADQLRARAASGKTAPAAAPSPAPAAVGKLSSAFAGKLVTMNGKKLTPLSSESLGGNKYYALYFSAQWCPPCRAFTPELVKAYKELKRKHPEFELVFISSDRSQDEMESYISDYKMPWPSVQFESAKNLGAVRPYRARGIPNLVFVTADGEVLSSSYANGEYVGPRKVLADIKKTLASKS